MTQNFLNFISFSKSGKIAGGGGVNPVILFHHPYYPATTGSKNIWTEPWQMCGGGGKAGGSKREPGLCSFVMQFSAKKFARLVTSGIYWIGHCVRCGVLLWCVVINCWQRERGVCCTAPSLVGRGRDGSKSSTCYQSWIVFIRTSGKSRGYMLLMKDLSVRRRTQDSNPGRNGDKRTCYHGATKPHAC